MEFTFPVSEINLHFYHSTENDFLSSVTNLINGFRQSTHLCSECFAFYYNGNEVMDNSACTIQRKVSGCRGESEVRGRSQEWDWSSKTRLLDNPEIIPRQNLGQKSNIWRQTKRVWRQAVGQLHSSSSGWDSWNQLLALHVRLKSKVLKPLSHSKASSDTLKERKSLLLN